MTQQQIDKLLQPRWIVIASFPDSEYEIGSIQDRNWTKFVNGEDESDGVLWRISDFPHIFRKLEWWEHRKESEMPKYVKHKETGQVISYAEGKKVATAAGILEQSLSMSLPATTEEYNLYINKQ